MAVKWSQGDSKHITNYTVRYKEQGGRLWSEVRIRQAVCTELMPDVVSVGCSEVMNVPSNLRSKTLTPVLDDVSSVARGIPQQKKMSGGAPERLVGLCRTDTVCA